MIVLDPAAVLPAPPPPPSARQASSPELDFLHELEGAARLVEVPKASGSPFLLRTANNPPTKANRPLPEPIPAEGSPKPSVRPNAHKPADPRASAPSRRTTRQDGSTAPAETEARPDSGEMLGATSGAPFQTPEQTLAGSAEPVFEPGLGVQPCQSETETLADPRAMAEAPAEAADAQPATAATGDLAFALRLAWNEPGEGADMPGHEPVVQSTKPPVAVTESDRQPKQSREAAGSAGGIEQEHPSSEESKVEVEAGADLTPPLETAESMQAPPIAPASPTRTDATTATRGTGEARPAETGALAEPRECAPPLRNVSLRVSGPNRERVDVCVLARQNELRVTVRSPDSDLSRGLREELSTLVRRLETSGYQTEVWRPAESGGPASDSGSHPSENETAPNHGNAGSQERGSGWRQEQRGDRGAEQHNQPRWVEELEERLKHGRVPGEREIPWSR